MLDEKIRITTLGLAYRPKCKKCKSEMFWNGEDWACLCGGRWYPHMIGVSQARKETRTYRPPKQYKAFNITSERRLEDNRRRRERMKAK